MNEKDVIQLVNMLWQATIEKKIEWKSAILSNENAYSTTIDDCLLIFSVYFDPMLELWVAQVEFYNSEGKTFFKAHYYENENIEAFKQIDRLSNVINDQMLLITESKRKIFNHLESILNKGKEEFN